jgi:hypothetical protein
MKLQFRDIMDEVDDDWDYISQDFVDVLDDGNILSMVRRHFIEQGIREEVQEDFADFYNDVAENVAKEIQENGEKYDFILESLFSTKAMSTYLVQFGNSCLYETELKKTIYSLVYCCLCWALYELIIVSQVANYLCMELAEYMYNQKYDNDYFPFDEMENYIESHTTTEHTIDGFREYCYEFFKNCQTEINLNVELPIGMTKEDVIKFLAEHNITVK